MDNDVISEEISFSVDARLIKELGEKLVTRDYLALAELIKNSFDADAPSVEIEFINVTGNTDDAKIRISDLGVGMTWDEFSKNWMRISTSNKEKNPVSQVYGRKKSGSKGLGRFSCQKLAKSLVIKTVAKAKGSNKFEVTSAEVEWDDFEDGRDLVETYCASERYYSSDSTLISGTTITLSGLKKIWTQRSYTNLQRQIASLSISMPIIRDGFEEDPGFEIVIKANEFESEDYKLSERVLDAGWGRLKGTVDSLGVVNLDFDGKLVGRKNHILSDKYPSLEGASFDITFLPERKNYQRNPQLMTLQQMKKIRESYSGIKVYSEGFRVYPYGQSGDDWLGLDEDVGRRKARVDNLELRKIANSYGLDSGRVLLDLFRNSSLIGSIKIDTNSNPLFEIKLNREGFVNNDASESLAKLMRHVVEWMTIQYSYFKYLHAENERSKAESDLEEYFSSKDLDPQSIDDVKPGEKSEFPENHEVKNSGKYFQKALSVLRDEAGYRKNISLDEPLEAEADESEEERADHNLIKAASTFIQKEYESNRKELTLLRAIASTGPLFFVFAHEFKSLVSHLDTDAGKIEQWLDSNKIDGSEWLSDIAFSLRRTRERFMSLENLIGVFATTHRTDTKKIRVLEAVRRVCDGFEFIVNGKEIEIDFATIDERLKTKDISDAAFYSILVNVISNSIKAVMAKGERKIRVTAHREDCLVLKVEDKGIGLSEDKWNDVFLPLVTDPAGNLYKELYGNIGNDELAVLGKGTGLGLNIVRGMVNDNNGKVSFIEPDEGWSTCIEIRLP